MALEAIQETMRTPPKGIIAVDGELGAGKTTLSNELSNIYKIPVIHVDDYLTKGQNQYVEAVHNDDLIRAIKCTPLPVIIEGACLLSVLSAIEVKPELHFFLYRANGNDYKKNSMIAVEVENYVKESQAPFRADKAIYMNNSQTNQLDVDIAYIKSKMVVSVILALGGVVALLVGAYVLTSGVSSEDSAVFEILGAKITAEGIGAVILASSVLWAYFSYLARPKYSRRRESKSDTAPDGTHSAYEFESATMMITDRKADK